MVVFPTPRQVAVRHIVPYLSARWQCGAPSRRHTTVVLSSAFRHQVAGQLVARLEGGEGQIPALVAGPVLAAAVSSDGGAALAAVANLDPLYLSDNPGRCRQEHLPVARRAGD